MEKWKSPERAEEERAGLRDWDERTTWPDEGERPVREGQRLSVEQTIQPYEKELKRRSTRRKWGGAGLFLLGVATTTTSCPFYAMALIGPHTMLVGLAMLVIEKYKEAGVPFELKIKPGAKHGFWND